MIKVGLHVDEVASLMSTPEEEYDDLERELRRSVFGPCPVQFIRGVVPSQVAGYGLDLYVFDFGGLAAMQFGNTESFMLRYVMPIVKVINDNPSTYFMVWSTLTRRYMQEGFLDLAGVQSLDEVEWPSNVILYPESYDEIEQTWPRLQQLLGIKEDET